MPKIVMKVNIPKNLEFVDLNQLERELNSVLDEKMVPRVKGEYKKTVRGWKHKPQFKSRSFRTSSSIGRFVFPSGINKDQYIWVHEGVKARMIIPHRAASLAFQPEYAASTRPGVIWSKSNVRSGMTIFPGAVNWPGIEARKFSEKIAENPMILKEFRREVENAIRRASR